MLNYLTICYVLCTFYAFNANIWFILILQRARIIPKLQCFCLILYPISLGCESNTMVRHFKKLSRAQRAKSIRLKNRRKWAARYADVLCQSSSDTSVDGQVTYEEREMPTPSNTVQSESAKESDDDGKWQIIRNYKSLYVFSQKVKHNRPPLIPHH